MSTNKVEPMSNASREVAVSFFEQVWNAGDETAISRLMAPNARIHGLPSSDGEPIVGPAGFTPFYLAFREAFPDIRVSVLRTVCEGNLVACYCVVTGTHKGAGLGVEATGAAMEINGMVMAIIEDGQIEEGWNCFDFMSLYQQVGMLPSLPAGQPPTVARA
jgi:steroid delta-isomerase-like uncharacterized protein